MNKAFFLLLAFAVLLSGCVQEPGPVQPYEPPEPEEVEVFYQPVQCILPPWGGDFSVQRLKDFYAKAGVEIVSVEKVESGNDVCNACYECVESYYLRAVVSEEYCARMALFGWTEELPGPDPVSLQYTVEEVVFEGIDFNSIGPEALSKPPFKATVQRDLGSIVLSKRVFSACFSEVYALGRLVSETRYEVSLLLHPKAPTEDNCLFDVNVVLQGLPESIEFVAIVFEGNSESFRPNSTVSGGIVPVYFQPMQCESFPWGDSILGVDIGDFYLSNYGLMVSGARRVESGVGACAACGVCPTSFYFEVGVLEADEERMVSLGWQAEKPFS